MYILNIMTENWTMMNETLPNPSLSFQGGEIWGKFFPPHPTLCVDLSPRRERYKKQLCLIWILGTSPRMTEKKRLEDD